MSYLPRMSKTYKEPQEPLFEEPEDPSPNTLKPASSLLNEKTHHPQMVLKHYRYLPHAPPVLPGPSLLEEVLENELYRETSRMRRSANKMESLSETNDLIMEPPSTEISETLVVGEESKIEIMEKAKRTHSRKGVKGIKSSLSRKKSGKTVKKDHTSSTIINMCAIDARKPFASVQSEIKLPNDSKLLGNEDATSLPILNTNENFPKSNESENLRTEECTNRSVQCTIFGSPTKVFLVPPVINSLIRSLAFLLYEIQHEKALIGVSKEKKTLMTQIQLMLGDLSNQKVDKDYGFDLTYSDSKRLEKIMGELKKYIKDNYEDKKTYAEKMEDLKKVFVELKQKEMELALLNEKVEEFEDNPDIAITEGDLKNPEITLQNKRLESEQLSAEVEFTSIELKNYQKSLAELDWDIKNFHKEMAGLKKSTGSKSKTDVFKKKICFQKFSSEILTKGGRNFEGEGLRKKKT